MGLHFPKIHLDSHTLGNLVKNLSPAAALVPGVGVVGAGLLSAAGDLARGKNVKQAALGGVENAALGGGLASLAGKAGIGTGAHLGFGLGGAQTATPAVNIGPLPGASAMGVPGGVGPASGLTETVAGTPGNFAGHLLSAGKGLAGFAEAHPNATSGALQGLGSITSSGSENRLRNAEAAQLEQKTGETQFDFDARKRREAALAPIWSSLGTSIGSGYPGVAKNPYAPTVG